MKKILFVMCMFMIFSSRVGAVCDYQREVELNKLASKISYDRTYNKEDGTYSVTLFNVISDLYLIYDNDSFVGDKNNEVLIENIQEGEYMDVVIYSAGPSSCYSSLMTLYITIPYFNPFYGEEECNGYEDILTLCSSQFVGYFVDAQILKDAIDNYNNKIYNEPTPLPVGDTTLLSGIKQFIALWGIKILLAVVTVGICIGYYQVVLRKIKHGI